ncbi:MAG TPA: 16S rRNA (cytosine(967)-C(5))-methyltransferase RsmB [Bacilli bacterium]|nr:16S rRNA (cytosine(967)-C(5))-methyltransferase RsmB [Bacilli bacterium]
MKNDNVRQVALDVLLKVDKEQAYSNLQLNQAIQKSQLDGRDIGLLTELVYGTIQHQLTLDFYLRPFVKKGLNKIERWVLILLRMSLYQIVYLDKIPERAAIYEAVQIAKKRGHQGIASMVNGVLRSIQRQGLPQVEDIQDDAERLSVKYSHPEWLVKRWIAQYGVAETEAMCKENVTAPHVTIRVNRTQATKSEVIESLEAEGVTVHEGHLAPDALVVTKGNVLYTQAFLQGKVTIQDESSMLVALVANPQPTDTVLDSCAAPGGKTTHLAEQMNGEGQIIALDLHEHKIKLISQLASRLKLKNIEGRQLDARKTIAEFEPESFDVILVDAPCSGFGVIRKKPDLKWSKQESDIEAIAKIQFDILSSVAPLVKKGGTLVYSTCTVDKTENEGTIERFLASYPQFELDERLSERLPEQILEKGRLKSGMLTILPHDFGTDGFFITAMKKQAT